MIIVKHISALPHAGRPSLTAAGGRPPGGGAEYSVQAGRLSD